jgi:hypothetical protein
MCYTDDDIVVFDGFRHENRTISSTDEGMKMTELKEEGNDLKEKARALHKENIRSGR